MVKQYIEVMISIHIGFKIQLQEEAMDIIHNNQNTQHKGQLKIFIGYAPGVGKTFSMLNEANRRFERGEDIVIGYIQCHGRAETAEQIRNLEIIPCKKIQTNDSIIEEMDVAAIIKRNPKIVLIDELAHSNLLEAKNTKRYEDVEEILSHGISVLTTLNIHHLESLNDIVRQITGIRVTETIPDKIIENANEVLIVDLTPVALQNRLKRGNIFGEESIDKATKNFFRRGNLNALRELALRQTAEEVDEDLAEYMKEHGIKENWHTVERVMVCISANPSAKKLIRRGARIAKRNKCELTVVSVNCTNKFVPTLTQKDIEMLNSHYKLAEQLGGQVVELTGKSVSNELSKFAMDKYITQIVIGHSNRTKKEIFLRGSTVNKLLRQTKDIEVHIIPTD